MCRTRSHLRIERMVITLSAIDIDAALSLGTAVAEKGVAEIAKLGPDFGAGISFARPLPAVGFGNGRSRYRAILSTIRPVHTDAPGLVCGHERNEVVGALKVGLGLIVLFVLGGPPGSLFIGTSHLFTFGCQSG